ncbi:MAG: cytochrome C oxidase subunit IV family protein [Bacteroidota bacterium]
MPKKVLYRVFGGLVFLTVLTVATAKADFGPLNFIHIPLALGIAGAKTFLVVMFFMALKYDNPVNLLTFLTSVVFVVIFITFTLFDTVFRGDMDNVETRTVMELQVEEEALQGREPDPSQLLVAPADYEAAARAAAQAAADTTATVPEDDAGAPDEAEAEGPDVGSP